MVKEQGTVVAVEQEELIVEVVRTSACKSCQARQGCGQAVLSEWGDSSKQQAKNHFRVPAGDYKASVGDRVELAMAPDTVSKVAALVYLLPLAGGFAGLFIGQWLLESELLQLLLFAAGVLLSYGLLSRLKLEKKSHLIPQIIHLYPAGKGSDVIESISL
ncbi:SoxR reducing system RseC family protein [Reinekea marinisedimentorum]|uniref:Sigma-E factor negative regulatory protein RseC n=1 Tax=Reinekea marinisedimentorum TaxID=230495 RepID=A0A4R3I3D5_9GAMM|nr:SoxR reducing system RseC family protein [Reinekea marinisedimentorum]TCS39804.1 sigma-E factor negative regulatory protein RseC [Reinekea marinisedimentorum]